MMDLHEFAVNDQHDVLTGKMFRYEMPLPNIWVASYNEVR